MDSKYSLNFTIFAVFLISFLMIFICHIGYKVFRSLACPDSPTDNDDGIDTVSDPPTISQFIRDNPFRKFVRSGMALDHFSTLYYYEYPVEL